MIDASIQAVPGLFISFGIIAAVLAIPTGLIARVRQKPVTVRVLFAVGIAGILAVTLLPTDGGPVSEESVCDLSSPFPQMFTSSSALLNVALFIPAPFFAGLIFRRHLTTLAVAVVSSGLIELIQAEGAMGRSCSATDIAANAFGTLIGVAAAALWLWRTGQGAWRGKPDVLWGAAIAALGTAALIGVFHSSVTSYIPITRRPGFEADQQAVEGANTWIADAATYVFGKGTQIEQTVVSKRSGLVTAKTNRGELSGWWYEKKLEEAAFADNKAEAGSLNQQQAQQVATASSRTDSPRRFGSHTNRPCQRIREYRGLRVHISSVQQRAHDAHAAERDGDLRRPHPELLRSRRKGPQATREHRFKERGIETSAQIHRSHCARRGTPCPESQGLWVATSMDDGR
ncbi:VanZ family protein [Streptomyces sp. NPDC006184]|uniref:VanZ family protein n=1 Tax=Streptomyces sp. NPDC006184 TaxID=3155455 RepID=UPI0033B6067E